MNDNDTSDEAFDIWWETITGVGWDGPSALKGWREAVRRCEARMEEERRKAFEAAWAIVPPNGTQSMEKRKQMREADYRAFKEGQK